MAPVQQRQEIPNRGLLNHRRESPPTLQNYVCPLPHHITLLPGDPAPPCPAPAPKLFRELRASSCIFCFFNHFNEIRFQKPVHYRKGKNTKISFLLGKKWVRDHGVDGRGTGRGAHRTCTLARQGCGPGWGAALAAREDPGPSPQGPWTHGEDEDGEGSARCSWGAVPGGPACAVGERGGRSGRLLPSVDPPHPDVPPSFSVGNIHTVFLRPRVISSVYQRALAF